MMCRRRTWCAAREAILARGGAARANVFTRIALALFGQVPWRAVPYIPVEIMLLPKWFPFHLDKVSYWSRTVMVPLFVLCTRKPLARNPHGVDIRELFTAPPWEERHYFARRGFANRFFMALDRMGRAIDPLIPRAMRARAMRAAQDWMLERLNGEGGLGAIFPAMVNALEVLVLMGVPPEDPRRATAKRAIEKLLVVGPRGGLLPALRLPGVGLGAGGAGDAGGRGCPGACGRRAGPRLAGARAAAGQSAGLAGTEARACRGGGWAFQFTNTHYPDLDDTAVVAWSMHQARDPERYASNITRALDWLVGLQSRNGGFAAFDADNTHYILNEIPFADHGALAGPAHQRCDRARGHAAGPGGASRGRDRRWQRAIAYLRAEQEPSGAWFGRWGTNFIYGTWSVLVALEAGRCGPRGPGRAPRGELAGLQAECRRRLGRTQRQLPRSPARPAARRRAPRSRRAWALLALLAAGEVESAVVRNGVRYLQRSQQKSGLWSDARFTAPGFPRVFYLKYHGYCAYFPLWALAAYRNRVAARSRRSECHGDRRGPDGRGAYPGPTVHGSPWTWPRSARDQRHGSAGRGPRGPGPGGRRCRGAAEFWIGRSP